MILRCENRVQQMNRLFHMAGRHFRVFTYIFSFQKKSNYRPAIRNRFRMHSFVFVAECFRNARKCDDTSVNEIHNFRNKKNYNQLLVNRLFLSKALFNSKLHLKNNRNNDVTNLNLENLFSVKFSAARRATVCSTTL